MDILSSLTDFLTGKAVPFVVLLGILVFVHELGHFLVARWNGVRVEVFSLGFGKRLFQFKRGDTVYCVSLIPLGGYVKMFGEQPGDSIAESDKAVSFTHKTVKQRMAIVLAGPLMNLMFAILLFGLVAFIGEEKKPSVLGDVEISSPAFQAGFRSGDHILSVDRASVRTWEELQTRLNENIGRSLSFEVQGQSEAQSKKIEAQVTEESNPNPIALRRTIGSIAGFQLYSQVPIVGVIKGSPLDLAGLKTGDMIKTFNDKPVSFWRDLNALARDLQPGGTLKLSIERLVDEEKLKFEEFNISVLIPETPSLAAAGIESSEVYLAKIIAGSPAERAGLKRGDRVVSVGEKNVERWEDVLSNIKSYSPESGEVRFRLLRDGAPLEVAVKPQMTSHMNSQGQEEKRYTVGIVPMISMTTEKSLIQKTRNPFSAVGHGLEKSYDMTVMTLMSFVRLISGDISPKNVGGVISIGQAASESYKAGLQFFIQMMGVISISLFVLNLLPIPVLDGGHLLFYTIELFKGSPISLRKMELAQQVGLALLMSLMLFALFNDVNRVFFGTY
jgi:regulator of sigma E protease